MSADAKTVAVQLQELLGQQLKLYGLECSVKPRSDKDAYKKTEQILWNYRPLQEILEDKLEYAEYIEQFGVPAGSKCVASYGEFFGKNNNKDLVNDILSEAMWINDTLCKINRALSYIKGDKYYDILEDYYFRGKSLDELAKRYNVEIAAISKRKAKLVKKLSLYLFPRQNFEEMLFGGI